MDEVHWSVAGHDRGSEMNVSRSVCMTLVLTMVAGSALPAFAQNRYQEEAAAAAQRRAERAAMRKAEEEAERQYQEELKAQQQAKTAQAGQEAAAPAGSSAAPSPVQAQ